jgi:hypothetical protein
MGLVEELGVDGNNIKMDVRNVEWKVLDLLGPSRCRDKWLFLVVTGKKFRFS